MRIVVVGAGAVGGTLGGRLAGAGHDVTLVARGPHLEAIRSGGLVLETPQEKRTLQVEATEDPATLEAADLVLVALRTYDVPDMVPRLDPLVGDGTALLPLGNGVTTADLLAERFGADHVLGGLAFLTGSVVEPGHVRQMEGACRVVVGELDGGTSTRVESLQDHLEGAGIDVVVAADVRGAMWSRFLLTCGFGGLACLARASAGELLGHDATRGLLREAMEEVADVGRARGIALATAAVDDAMATLERLDPDTRPTLLRDLEAGRPLEVNELNGQVDGWGKQLEVPTPVNHVVARVLRPRAGGEHRSAEADAQGD